MAESDTLAQQVLDNFDDAVREQIGVKKLYLISYDIRCAKERYNRIRDKILATLAEFGSEKVLESQYLIQSTLPITKIRNTIIRDVGQDDQELVGLLILPLPPLSDISWHGIDLPTIISHFP